MRELAISLTELATSLTELETPTSVPTYPFQDYEAIGNFDIRVRVAIQFMKDNLEERMPLEELASLVGLSASRFRHLFSTQTGMSPKKCLRKLRLERARLLLEDGGLTIDQVTLRVGWRDRSHFERRFKQLYEVTPAQYRTRYQAALMNRSHKRALAATLATT